jgi:hypothetical protein
MCDSEPRIPRRQMAILVLLKTAKKKRGEHEDIIL